MRDTNQLAPPIAFLHLAVDQASRHLPLAHIAPAMAEGEPLTKVSGERIEVEIKPVTRKEREATRGQALSKRVDDPMRHVLRAGAEFKHGKNRA